MPTQLTEPVPPEEKRICYSDIKELYTPEGFEIDEKRQIYLNSATGTYHIPIISVSASGICPDCGQESTHPNGYSYRYLQGMPIHGHPVVYEAKERRFYCRNESCERISFNEAATGMKKNQRRIDEVTLLIFTISIFCTASSTALICEQLGILVSHDTINRLFIHVQVEDDQDVLYVGVDDVAIRKGQTYHTVIYNGDTHNLIALLDGRDGKELEKYLLTHPKIKIVTRDRASAYSTAISKVLGCCCDQVADRFHLFKNLIDYLYDIFKTEIPSTVYIKDEEVLEEEPEMKLVYKVPLDSPVLSELDYDNEPPLDAEGNPIEYCDKRRDEDSSQYKRHATGRKEKYDQIVRIREEWNAAEHPKKKDFQEKYGISNATLNKYLAMSPEEVEETLEITKYKTRKSVIDNFKNMIYKMLRDGIDPAVIFSYVLSKGYEGNEESLMKWIQLLAKNNFQIRLGRNFPYKKQLPEDVEVIKRFDLMKVITVRNEKKKEKLMETPAAKHLGLLKEKYPIIGQVEEIYGDYCRVFDGQDVQQLDLFVEKYQNSEISSFINGIKKDIAAVKNTISFPNISSGFVEGGNNLYKTEKRMLYGRAGTTLLFTRTYAISIIHKLGVSPSDLLKAWFSA